MSKKSKAAASAGKLAKGKKVIEAARKVPFKKIRKMINTGKKVNKHRKKISKVVYTAMYVFTNWKNKKVKY